MAISLSNKHFSIKMYFLHLHLSLSMNLYCKWWVYPDLFNWNLITAGSYNGKSVLHERAKVSNISEDIRNQYLLGYFSPSFKFPLNILFTNILFALNIRYIMYLHAIILNINILCISKTWHEVNSEHIFRISIF